MKRLLAIVILASVYASAYAEDKSEFNEHDVYGNPVKTIPKVEKPPAQAWKLRLVPLFGGIVSSVNASRFDHAIGIDYEKWMTTTTSLS